MLYTSQINLSYLYMYNYWVERLNLNCRVQKECDENDDDDVDEDVIAGKATSTKRHKRMLISVLDVYLLSPLLLYFPEWLFFN